MWFEWLNIQQGMSPQLYMSMHRLNNLFNNNVQYQRLDDINDNDNKNTTTTTTTRTQQRLHNIIP